MVKKFRTSCFSKAFLLVLLLLGIFQVSTALQNVQSERVAVEEPKKIVNIVLLGSTGNLAEKYLWQSLFNIHRDGIRNNLKLYVYPSASSSKEKASDKLNRILLNNMTVEGTDELEKQRLKTFRKKHIFDYHQLRDAADFIVLNKKIQNQLNKCNCIEVSRIFYLSVPPRFFASIAKNLKESGLLTPATSIIVEKPFGNDFSSAQDLSSLLFKYLPESSVKLVDHYMGKQALEALRIFRLNNPFQHKVVSLESVMFEKETCAGRAWFYDGVGVVKDTMQNHLMMMLALFVADLTTPEEHVDRLLSLRSLEIPSTPNIIHLGQYEGYKEHLVEDEFPYKTAMRSKTATYAEVLFKVIRNQTELLPGSEVIFKSGKALDRRTAYIKATFEDGSVVILNIQGKNDFIDGTGLSITSLSGWKVNLPESWTHVYQENTAGLMEQTIRFNEPGVRVPSAYEVLLRAAVEGNDQYFVSLHEVLQSWKLLREILPVIEATKPEVYEIGSNPNILGQSHTKNEL